MAAWGFGLRAKSMLALAVACLLALLFAWAVGWKVLDSVRNHFGEAYARSYTLLNAQQLLAPVLRELALAKRMADSVLLREWLRDVEDVHKKAIAFREVEGFRRDFRERNYFIASRGNLSYYFNQPDMEYSESPRYALDPENHENAWFFRTLESDRDFNINVNPDPLGFTKVWFNVIVRDNGEALGVSGSGLDLTNFIEDFIKAEEAGVTPIIIDRRGAIQAHPDPSLISYDAGSGASWDEDAAHEVHRLETLLASAGQRAELEAALNRAEMNPGGVETFWVEFDGRHQLMALTHIPELAWYVVTAVDLDQADILQGGWFWGAFAALLSLLLVLVGVFGLAVERMVLRPLRNLRQSATALAQGDFNVALPPPGRDELGDLSRAFGTMAGQIRRHTEELEDKVRQRTRELEARNRDMAAAQKKINDSIDYASLIQRALLPDRQIARHLGPHHFIMWHPRDVVGGDFYLFHSDGDRHLIGVVDCAGHGVPGALMTMLARAAFYDAINRSGLDSPADLLGHADAHLREMLRQSELPRAIATNMDAGLACIDRGKGLLRYAGAKISLYWSDGRTVDEIPGGKRPLLDRRIGGYHDTELPLRGDVTYYLATDGYLDQAGGEHGFGFGNSHFADLLRAHARLPMEQQAEALRNALQDYRGGLPQRDDITVLSFCIN